MGGTRLTGEAGIALGAILFAVALLGLLAAVISAASGSFHGSSNAEAARTKASALIQIGLLLKAGSDRMIGSGIDFDSIVIDPLSTENEIDLFAPSGGGVNMSSATMANDPSSDTWHYPFAALPQMGTSATERVAMLKVAPDVCDQINLKVNAIATVASDSSMGNDIGDVTAASLSGSAGWPVPLASKENGCLRNTNSATPGFFYYQVLGIR